MRAPKDIFQFLCAVTLVGISEQGNCEATFCWLLKYVFSLAPSSLNKFVDLNAHANRNTDSLAYFLRVLRVSCFAFDRFIVVRSRLHQLALRLLSSFALLKSWNFFPKRTLHLFQPLASRYKFRKRNRYLRLIFCISSVSLQFLAIKL